MHASLSRATTIGFGYIWPAYLTYKAVSEGHEERLREWCIYWLVMGIFMSLEWLCDTFIFWLPFYYEAKLLFIIALWHPRTRLALIVYDRFVQPLLRTYEGTIDQSLEEAKTRAMDTISSQVTRVRGYVEQHFHGGAIQDMLSHMKHFSEGAVGHPRSAAHAGAGSRAHAE